MSEDDSTTDRTTGLLHREAFLDEVRAAKNTQPDHTRRGCLLVLNFPTLKEILEQHGSTAASDALNVLLAIVETRLRSRDTLGRIGEHSVCLLLRKCREADALTIADQYAVLLRDVVIEPAGVRVRIDVRYRIISLDSRGGRSRKGLSRLVKGVDISEASKLLSDMNTHSKALDNHVAKVVSLNAKRGESDNTPASADTAKADDSIARSEPDVAAVQNASVVSLYPSDNVIASPAWAMRLKPGLMLDHQPLIGCYRVRSVGGADNQLPLENSAQVAEVLDALSPLAQSNKKALIDCQLIVQMDASRLSLQSASWLLDQCREKRITPSDLCLALPIDSINLDLRGTLPVLRRLNRLGVKLMLEGVNSEIQFSTIHKLVGFEFLMISARVLQGSLNAVRTHKELESLIREVHVQKRQLCASGIDTAALLNHARALGVDIGFGRACGRSIAFPGNPGQ